METAGKRLRNALTQEQPLQMVGAINAYCALLAEHAGYRALYLSGAGVANASLGLPDLGLTRLEDHVEDIRRITARTDLPLLVDCDTGFGDVAQTVEHYETAGAAGLHIEDQVADKRCGHHPNKRLVTAEAMTGRIETAVAARSDPDFVIMARTDAICAEGTEAALARIKGYIAAGADMIFPEAITDLDQLRRITAEIDVPVLVNITEFGKTPLFSLEQLADAGAAIALYPLTAFRAMGAAAWEAYTTLRHEGTQQDLLERMQTREELYEHLDYYRYEQAIDERLDHERDDE